jgi:triosephosphate isomerase
MRRPVIAGNWKMFKTVQETVQFIEQLKGLVQSASQCDIVVAPPFTALAEAVKAARGSKINVASQNIHWENDGAYTGEISAGMLLDLGVNYAIIGHSERRQYFAETDQTVNQRLKAALKAKLIPIVCIGEVLAEREGNRTQAVIEAQFNGAMAGLTAEEFSPIIIAYEPVWAIGTGKTATPAIAEEVHAQIRALTRARFGEAAAQALRILYGGSVKPDNIKGLMAEADIDGALVGGASLKAESFAALVNY